MIELAKLLKSRSVIAVAPRYDGTHSSIVYTHLGSLYKEEAVDDIMDNLCRYFGSTLEGRKKATRHKLSVRKNPSILLSEILQACAFEIPHVNQESIWIIDLNYQVEELERGCVLIFNDHVRIVTTLSVNVVNNRRQKTIQMLHEFTHNLVNHKVKLQSVGRFLHPH